MDASVTRLKALAGAPIDPQVGAAATTPVSPVGESVKGNPTALLPADAADVYMDLRALWQGPIPLLRYHRGEWFRFNGKIFVRVEQDELKADVMRCLRQLNRAKANTSFQASVIANLHPVCAMPSSIDLPARMTGIEWKGASDWIVVHNGILDVGALLRRSGEVVLSPHAPSFVSTILLPFAYDPGASCDRWEAFLVEVLPSLESRMLLQELFGYCLTFDLSQQKFFLLLGFRGKRKGCGATGPAGVAWAR